ncbi:glutamine amidotransferase [Collinsella sp. zg1085]|uniref:glutamine amidotransferase n=1 Tax=Collinsella sp. zg1085 TaxID=2844380 RepID=UPI00209AC6A3|nr:glutamine amidotransferase [Collinsella sp. zg1085]
MTTIELLYPEFGNQAGDNGNALYLKACLPHAQFIETSFGQEPAFVGRNDISCILLGCMTEKQQERVLNELLPHAERLKELIDQGVSMLFTGNAVELLGTMIITPQGRGLPALGVANFVTHIKMPTRYVSVCKGSCQLNHASEPFELVGCKMQFTQAEPGGKVPALAELSQGFGLNEGSTYEGVHIKNLVGTWFLGPVLTQNPPLTRWLLDTMGETEAPLAYHDLVWEGYRQRVQDFATPGISL